MAKTLGVNPWIFTAIADAEGVGNGGEHDHPLYVHHLTFIAGDADDDIEILDAASGNRIAFVKTPTADDEIWWDVGHFVSGIYVNQLPTNGEVHVHLGNPRS